MKKRKITIGNRYGDHNTNKSVFGEKRIRESFFKNR